MNIIPWGFWCNTARESGIDFNDTAIDDGGNLRIVKGTEYIIQTIKNNLWLYLREYPFDVTIGTPYNTLLGSNASQALYRYYVEKAIFAVNTSLSLAQKKIWGVKKIERINFVLSETRNVTVNVDITFFSGQTERIVAENVFN